jgi:DNA modification methylase
MSSELKLDIIHLGDCRDVLKTFPDGKVDLIVTSPPYASHKAKAKV